MKKLLLSSACLLALGALSGASADPWAATIAGDYTHTNYNIGHIGCPNTFCNVSGYDVDGAVHLPWNLWGVGFELDAASHGTGAGHDTQGGGSLVWDNIPNVRLAGTAVYNWTNIIEVKFPEWQVGAGAEWYANPWLTVSAQGGGIAGKFSGGYFGGTLKGYICPDL